MSIDISGYGKVLTPSGVMVLNDLADVDPRKAYIFNNRLAALDGIDGAAPTYKRVEGLILFYRENSRIRAGIFDGGILDEHFKPFIVPIIPIIDLPTLI
jgi:hypothetical protein